MAVKDNTLIEKIRRLHMERARHVQAIEAIDRLIAKHEKDAVANDERLNPSSPILGRMPYGDSDPSTPHA